MVIDIHDDLEKIRSVHENLKETQRSLEVKLADYIHKYFPDVEESTFAIVNGSTIVMWFYFHKDPEFPEDASVDLDYSADPDPILIFLTP